jgi:hypothetical protein
MLLMKSLLSEDEVSSLPIKQLVHDALSQVEEPDLGQFILCGDCRQPVTASNFRISIGGEHQHRFVNPDGVIFEVSCFHSAPGTLINGQATARHCWFRGFRWQYAHCEHCAEQLGWYYENGLREAFFALIPSSLIYSNKA